MNTNTLIIGLTIIALIFIGMTLYLNHENTKQRTLIKYYQKKITEYEIKEDKQNE